MKRYTACICLGLLLIASSANAQLINFDDVPDATDIRTHYQGITFSCAGVHCANPPVVWARQTTGAPSAPNTVSLIAAPNVAGVHNPTTGTIKIAIACLASRVSVKAKSTQVPEPLNLVQHAIIVAENASNVGVGQATVTQFGQFETLTVNSPTNLIATVLLGVEGTGVAGVAQFDDLDIQCAPRLIWWPIFVIVILVLAVGFWFLKRQRVKKAAA